MRPLIFLFPHDRMDIGGNSAQVRFMKACGRFTRAEAAFYGEPVQEQPDLEQILSDCRSLEAAHQPIFIIHWGPDVARLLSRLTGYDVVYVAHSTGWGFTPPAHVPILCVSRHTMAYWGRHAPNSYIALTPNVVSTVGHASQEARDIDVLVQTRKSSHYLLHRLVPALRTHCRVQLLDGWVDDLGGWFERSKVYLYDSVEHWIDVGATEGFGLPPLEAMGRGCVVFSSVNDALADYCDPGVNCRKLRVHSLAWDKNAILRAVAERVPSPLPTQLFEAYSENAIAARLETQLAEIERFFAATSHTSTDIDDLWKARRPGVLQRAKRAAKLLAGV
ncbi:glycosyltransferase family 4 protein [Novosphingobium sp. Leaf2]|uniref:glycosyltransferase family 4 protein n=1 Tax=Novosphingobium sp. Leaf2 TaxID=1735670 RepID=UPI0006FD3F6D|nr:glycosyltransferase family 4 protein [Novosphingobium sp. Leaf2]KQM13775.1 hypothetical protein ASE49_11965 [Novosphingobium sp. Leaf2]